MPIWGTSKCIPLVLGKGTVSLKTDYPVKLLPGRPGRHSISITEVRRRCDTLRRTGASIISGRSRRVALMSQRTGFRSQFIALLFLIQCSLLVFGQDNVNSTQMNQNRTVSTPLQVSLTGCLKKSGESGGYYLTDQNGRTWELSSKQVDFSKHMNQVVNVSGHPSAGSKTQEAKSQPSQKTEGSHQPLGLDITELKVVSPSCTR